MLEQALLGDKTGGGFYRKATGKGAERVIDLDLTTLEYRARSPPQFPELAEVAKIRDLGKRVHAALRAGPRRRVPAPSTSRSSTTRPPPRRDLRHPRSRSTTPWLGLRLAARPLRPHGRRRRRLEPRAAREAGEPAPAALRPRRKARRRRPLVRRPPQRPHRVRPRRRPAPPPTPRRRAPARPQGRVGLLHRNDTASLIDLGDGIACLEFRGKMNVLDDGALTMLREADPRPPALGGFRGLVIGNQSDNFCAGADLRRSSPRQRPATSRPRGRRRRPPDRPHGPAPRPAPGRRRPARHDPRRRRRGHPARPRVVADSELYMGLVEIGVGLLPAGGGLKEMAAAPPSGPPRSPAATPTRSSAAPSSTPPPARSRLSAHEARSMGFLRPATASCSTAPA
jgi:3-hydroxyacyl-CoA dehydrogenase